MGDLFKGWRKKTGVMTLVVACAVMAAWVRTTVSGEQISVQRTNELECPIHCFRSADGCFGYIRISGCQFPDRFTWYSFPVGQPFDEHQTADWQFNCGLFQIGQRKPAGEIEKSYCFIPYWSLAGPMIMLSLWLLLDKPGKKTSRSTCTIQTILSRKHQ